MVNWRWVPPTLIVLIPEVMVGAEPHPALRAAMVTSVRVVSPRRREVTRRIFMSPGRWSRNKCDSERD